MTHVVDAVRRTRKSISMTSYSYDNAVLHDTLCQALLGELPRTPDDPCEPVRMLGIQDRNMMLKGTSRMSWRLLELYELGAEIRLWSIGPYVGVGKRFPCGLKGSLYSYGHLKSVVVDGALAIYGSQNWSKNSDLNCAEMICISQLLDTVAAIYAEHKRLYEESVPISQEDIDILRCKGRGQDNKAAAYRDADDREEKELQGIAMPDSRKAIRGPQRFKNGEPLYAVSRDASSSSKLCADISEGLDNNTSAIPLWENVAFNPRISFAEVSARFRARGRFFEVADPADLGRLNPDQLLKRAKALHRAWSAHICRPLSELRPYEEIATDGSSTNLEYMHPWDESDTHAMNNYAHNA